MNNLTDFINLLQKEGELKEIDAEVDPALEITEIYERIAKQGGPALLFNRVKGFDIPLLINAFGSQKRIGLALGVRHPDEIAARISSFFGIRSPDSFFDKLKLLPKLKELSHLAPKMARNAPCQEIKIKEGLILDRLPVLKCWPKDGGRYLTLPLVVTKDPETGIRNMGMYRMQVYDNRTTGMTGWFVGLVHLL